MAPKALPSPEVLRQLLRYEPETGKLFWLPQDVSAFADSPSRSAVHNQRLWNAQRAGKEAFTALNTAGYRQGVIRSKHYVAHHVIWALYTGEWPKKEIDHIDGVRENNRFSNLREATRFENQHNKRIYKNNTSGFKGVSWMARERLWRARIGIGGERKRLGDFPTIEEAADAYAKASAELHGAFSRLR